jgi:uncharacterized protein (TIGR02594 family)
MSLITPYQCAERFRGEVRELPGAADSPIIQWFHELAGLGPNEHDEVPWCSGFVNAMAWLANLPRSKRANARSWLNVGQVIDLSEAEVGYDVVVLKRLINGRDDGYSGHVGFYAGRTSTHVFLLGGNQSNQVTLAPFPLKDILGVRRLA